MGWLVSGAFTLVAVVVSAWLIDKHLRYFFAPHTQRHIVRILFLVPIYAICSFLSYYFYHQGEFSLILKMAYARAELRSSALGWSSAMIRHCSRPRPPLSEG